jgi:hypothetical protein
MSIFLKLIIPCFQITDTTFAPSSCDNGHDVLNTKPKILFCDLKILPGETKSCA